MTVNGGMRGRSGDVNFTGRGVTIALMLAWSTIPLSIFIQSSFRGRLAFHVPDKKGDVRRSCGRDENYCRLAEWHQSKTENRKTFMPDGI